MPGPRKRISLEGRNFLGQRKKPKFLKPAQIEVVVNTINSAMNDDRCSECRVYWNEQGVWAKPVVIGKGNKLPEG
jgi:hypothetical protein